MFYIGLQPEGTLLTASLHELKNGKSEMDGSKKKKECEYLTRDI